jgi:low affinity Fe/Cu permease
LPFRSYVTYLGQVAAHPAAIGIVAVYAILWFIFERESFDWHAIATLCTWAMTLFIQRSESRDTLALHAKLDELLRASKNARNDLMFIDDKDLEEVKDHRDVERDASST